MYAHIHECPDCGLLNRLSAPVAGTKICCARCGHVLRRVVNHALERGLAWCIAGLSFFILAAVTPMLQIGLYGQSRSGAIETGPLTLDNQGYWPLAAVVLLTTLVLPFVKIVGTMIVLLRLRIGKADRRTAHLFAMMIHLKPWVMVEVYLLGFIVAYNRLRLIADVHLAIAVLGLLGGMASLIALDAALDPEAVWEKIAARHPVIPFSPYHRLTGCDTCHQASPIGLRHCPRCGEVLHHRKHGSLNRAWALTIAAAILYIPSNFYPIMNITKLGQTQGYTIYAGLQELIRVGLWPLGLLVFVASIAIPVFKLVFLGALMIQTQYGAKGRLHHRTRLYRVLDFIGRWSMVDIFVVSILVALVRFGWVTQITADVGAVYFCAVVILTLLAVKSFDPRLMWDAAGGGRKSRLTASSSGHKLPA